MKKALIALSLLAVVAAISGARYATGSGNRPQSEAGRTVTVQGTHIENGCAYTVGTNTIR